MTDEQGSVVELVRYGALGEAQILAPDGVTERAVSVVNNPHHFQGLWWDDETSTYHNRHRQYDPQSGEYLSPDPAGLWRHGQGNGYSAFGSDPWNRRDPWGLNPGDELSQHYADLFLFGSGAPNEPGAPVAGESPPIPRFLPGAPCYASHDPFPVGAPRDRDSSNFDWDDVQIGLDMASMALDATGVGAVGSWIPDVVNGLISALREDFVGAGLSVLAALPFVGNAANAARIKRGAGICGKGGKAAKGGGRGKNKLKPNPNATGLHSTWKTDADGNIMGHAEWKPNSRNPSGFDKVKRVDLQGGSHYNKATGQDVPTPHTHGPNIPGGVRPANPSEIPGGGN